MKSYDSALEKSPAFANRMSHLVAPDGKVLAEYTNMDYSAHVDTMLRRAESLAGVALRGSMR